MFKTYGVTSCSITFIFSFSSSNKLSSTFATIYLMWKLYQLFPSFFFSLFCFLFQGLSSFPLLFAEDTAMQMINKVIETLPSDFPKPELQPARLLHLCSIIQASFFAWLQQKLLTAATAFSPDWYLDNLSSVSWQATPLTTAKAAQHSQLERGGQAVQTNTQCWPISKCLSREHWSCKNGFIPEWTEKLEFPTKEH